MVLRFCKSRHVKKIYNFVPHGFHDWQKPEEMSMAFLAYVAKVRLSKHIVNSFSSELAGELALGLC